MPPYHSVAGNNVTLYLNVSADSDGELGNPIDNILQQLAAQWLPIAAANGLNLTLGLSSTTPPTMNAIPNGMNVLTNAIPPADVQFFDFKVGRGKGAVAATRSGRVSYVNYNNGSGYIYEVPIATLPAVPAVSHELGHVLGLSDRYYEGAYWLRNVAINRTCGQIRNSLYVVGSTDYRDGIADTSNAQHDLPRLAVRMTLPMATQMVPDSSYDPLNNLMSNGKSSLSTAQIGLILSQAAEPQYRRTNWVAILGDWKRRSTPLLNIPAGATDTTPDYPDSDNNDLSKWVYPAWEARPEDGGGQGLLFLPPGHLTPHRYGCLSSFSRGKGGDGVVIQIARLAAASGKTRVFAFGGTTYNIIGMNVVHPKWMCHMQRLMADLM